jgi:hypothetical protein
MIHSENKIRVKKFPFFIEQIVIDDINCHRGVTLTHSVTVCHICLILQLSDFCFLCNF